MSRNISIFNNGTDDMIIKHIRGTRNTSYSLGVYEDTDECFECELEPGDMIIIEEEDE